MRLHNFQVVGCLFKLTNGCCPGFHTVSLFKSLWTPQRQPWRVGAQCVTHPVSTRPHGVHLTQGHQRIQERLRRSDKKEECDARRTQRKTGLTEKRFMCSVFSGLFLCAPLCTERFRPKGTSFLVLGFRLPGQSCFSCILKDSSLHTTLPPCRVKFVDLLQNQAQQDKATP